MKKTKLKNFSKLPKAKLVELLKQITFHLRKVDGYWFLAAEEKYGTHAATDLDEAVWRRLGSADAKLLRRIFAVRGRGLSSLSNLLKLMYSVFHFGEFEILTEFKKELDFQIVHCYPQEARLKSGLPIFDCKGVDMAYFSNFAQAVNPKIRVECIFAPPERRKGAWCAWRFRLGQKIHKRYHG